MSKLEIIEPTSSSSSSPSMKISFNIHYHYAHAIERGRKTSIAEISDEKEVIVKIDDNLINPTSLFIRFSTNGINVFKTKSEDINTAQIAIDKLKVANIELEKKCIENELILQAHFEQMKIKYTEIKNDFLKQNNPNINIFNNELNHINDTATYEQNAHGLNCIVSSIVANIDQQYEQTEKQILEKQGSLQKVIKEEQRKLQQNISMGMSWGYNTEQQKQMRLDIKNKEDEEQTLIQKTQMQREQLRKENAELPIKQLYTDYQQIRDSGNTVQQPWLLKEQIRGKTNEIQKLEKDLEVTMNIKMDIDTYSGIASINLTEIDYSYEADLGYFKKFKHLVHKGYRGVGGYPAQYEDVTIYKPSSDFGYIFESPPRILELLFKGLAVVDKLQAGILTIRTSFLDKTGYKTQLEPEFILDFVRLIESRILSEEQKLVSKVDIYVQTDVSIFNNHGEDGSEVLLSGNISAPLLDGLHL